MKPLHRHSRHKCVKDDWYGSTINVCLDKKNALDAKLGDGSTYSYVLSYGKMPSWKYIREIKRR